jgi:Arc/MetJ family transcription regulator
MARLVLEVDSALLAEAAAELGTVTNSATVHEALRHVAVVSREHRRTALESLRRIADDGGFDFDRLPSLDY